MVHCTVVVYTVGGTVVYCGSAHRMGYSGILWGVHTVGATVVYFGGTHSGRGTGGS